MTDVVCDTSCINVFYCSKTMAFCLVLSDDAQHFIGFFFLVAAAY